MIVVRLSGMGVCATCEMRRAPFVRHRKINFVFAGISLDMRGVVRDNHFQAGGGVVFLRLKPLFTEVIK